MNWGFLLFRGSYTYKKGLIVQSSSKTTQLLDPLFFMKINNVFVEYAGNNVFKKVIMIEHRHGPV